MDWYYLFEFIRYCVELNEIYAAWRIYSILYVISLWLFNVYMDGVVREVNECKGAWERAGVAECEWWQV